MAALRFVLLVVAGLAVGCSPDDGGADPATSPSTMPSTTTTTIAAATTVPPSTTSTPAARPILQSTIETIDFEVDREPAGVVGVMFGDASGDGVADAAVALDVSSTGRPRTVGALVVVHHDGVELHVSEPLRFERARIHDLRVEDGVVIRSSDSLSIGSTQTTTRYALESGRLIETEVETDVLVYGNEFGLLLGERDPFEVRFGSTRQEVADALVAVLGEPEDREPTETCWGTTEVLWWSGGADEHIGLLFRNDEFFEWFATDPRISATFNGVSPGASADWLEQVFGVDEFEPTYFELGGRWHLANMRHVGATLDPDGAEVDEVWNQWSREWDRLHTVVHDPVEHPDLWCGD